MRTLIAFSSDSGNTEKLAQVIFDTTAGDRVLKRIVDIRDVNGFDLIYIGFPIHNFEPCNDAKNFIKKIGENQKVVLFATHAMQIETPMNSKQIENCKKTAEHLELSGIYTCRGELSGSIAEKMLNSENQQLRFFGEMRTQTVGHPDKKELEDLRKFVEDIQNLLN